MPQPAPLMPSASVILVEAASAAAPEPRVFLLRRRAESSFMPNRYVFPGGKVEDEDGEPAMSPAALAACARRELFEEAGVQLTSQDQLVPYARWITPAARPKRFDTQFFLAQLPAGQQAQADLRESSRGLWLSPAQALRENLAGAVELAPPQVIILGQLSQTGGWRGFVELAASLPPEPVLPLLWLGQGLRIILLPHDPEYALGAPSHPQQPGQPCQAAQASRLVHQNGLWLPHRVMD